MRRVDAQEPTTARLEAVVEAIRPLLQQGGFTHSKDDGPDIRSVAAAALRASEDGFSGRGTGR